MTKRKAKPSRRASRTPVHLPKGWTQKRVDGIARYYENQSDEEAIAEAEAAYAAEGLAMIQVPIKLLPEVQRLLAKRAG